MVNPIGIIQGRLTESRGILQCFPNRFWKEEFHVANEIGLDYIELISDRVSNVNNPLWTGNELKSLISKSEILNRGLISMTVDHIMDRPLTDINVRESSLIDLKKIIKHAESVGVEIIVLPFLEAASIKAINNKVDILSSLINELIIFTEGKIVFAMENDLSIDDQLNIYSAVNSKNFGICYDTGNRSYLGFDIVNEIKILNKAIVHVHIKDKLSDGKNVILGTGNSNLVGAINSFKQIEYSGAYTMETSRGDNELKSAIYNLNYIKRLLN